MRISVLALGLVVPALVAVGGPAVAAAPTCRGLEATIVGTPGNDVITGTRRPDVIATRGGDDRILGMGDDDVICGGSGRDRLIGGAGDDRLYGGSDRLEERKRRTRVFGDFLMGGPGADLLSVGTTPARKDYVFWEPNTISYELSPRGVTVDIRHRTAVGEGADTISGIEPLEVLGSRHDDVMLGSRFPDHFDGGRGDDRLSGRAGKDVLLDYHGHDQIDGGNDGDFIISTAGKDSIDGAGGSDWLIAASSGTTSVYGRRGDDYIQRYITPGETGVIDGGAGYNPFEITPQLWFDKNPSVAVDAEARTIVVTAEELTQTTTFTGMANFILWGWDEDWTFSGTAGDDFVQVLQGSLEAQTFGGDDIMYGDTGDDVLDGGDGTDIAWGGRGDNTCVDTEEGDCDRLPWERRASEMPEGGIGTASPERLVRYWLNGQPLTQPAR